MHIKKNKLIKTDNIINLDQYKKEGYTDIVMDS